MATKARVITTPTSINRARSRISRSSKVTSASLLERVKSINADSEEEALFLTQFSRQSTFVDKGFLNDFESNNYSLSDDEKDPVDKRLEPQDVRRRLYLKECEKCKVVPVSAYMRHPMKNSLVMRHYNIGPQGAKALSAPLMVDTSITYVDLTGNAIGPIGLKFLFDAFGDNSPVTYLNISNNNLGKEGAEIVTSYLVRQGVLESVSLSDNGFNDADGIVLSRIIKENKSLKKLVLSKNEFGEKAGIAIGKAIASNDRLDTLDLSCNHIRRKGAAVIASGIKDNVGLKRIDLSFNGFGSEGMVTLAIAIKENSTLTELDVSHNRIKDADAEIFANQLGKNDTLKILRLGDNLLTSKGTLKIIKGINGANSACVLDTLDLKTTGVSLDFIEELQELKNKRDINVIHGKVIECYEPDEEGNTKPVVKNNRLPRSTRKPEKKVLEKAKTDIDTKSSKIENIYQVEITHDINGNRTGDMELTHDGESVFEVDDELEKEVDIVFGNEQYDGDVSCNEEENQHEEMSSVTNNVNDRNENMTNGKS